MGRAYIPAAAAPTPDKARSHAVSKHGGGVRRGWGGLGPGTSLGWAPGSPRYRVFYNPRPHPEPLETRPGGREGLCEQAMNLPGPVGVGTPAWPTAGSL